MNILLLWCQKQKSCSSVLLSIITIVLFLLYGKSQGSDRCQKMTESIGRFCLNTIFLDIYKKDSSWQHYLLEDWQVDKARNGGRHGNRWHLLSFRLLPSTYSNRKSGKDFSNHNKEESQFEEIRANEESSGGIVNQIRNNVIPGTDHPHPAAQFNYKIVLLRLHLVRA